jgi:subtilisin family serine protease
MKHPIRAAVLAAAVVASLGLSSTAAMAAGRPDLVIAGLQSGKPHRADELLVKYREGASLSQRDVVRRGLGAQALETVRGGKKDGQLVLYRLPSGVGVGAAVRALRDDPAVEYAEPNWIYRHNATSNDTYYTNGSLWGMYGNTTSPSNEFGSQAAEAWAAGHTSCDNVYVGVIDEGIYYGHEDLAANIWTNPYDPVDGVDNDGNGYVDDVHGWDFEGDSNDINAGGSNDDHGTHVSGTIAGVGGNGKGVAGVCWSGVKLISGRFLGRRGGTTADAVRAIDYFNDLKARHGINIAATNNSWGGGGYSQALSDAIDRAGQADILFIVAAGNDSVNCDGNTSGACYPAGYPNSNILSVAALRSNGALVYNYGATTVDIGAPGYGIVSTVPARSKGSVVSGYASYSGTSMATPHVAGAAALYASTHPLATAAQVKQAILDAAVPTPSLQGKTTTGGRLDASGF